MTVLETRRLEKKKKFNRDPMIAILLIPRIRSVCLVHSVLSYSLQGELRDIKELHAARFSLRVSIQTPLSRYK